MYYITIINNVYMYNQNVLHTVTKISIATYFHTNDELLTMGKSHTGLNTFEWCLYQCPEVRGCNLSWSSIILIS